MPSISSGLRESTKLRGDNACAVLIALKAHHVDFVCHQMFRQLRNRASGGNHSCNWSRVMIILVGHLSNIRDSNRVPIFKKDDAYRLFNAIYVHKSEPSSAYVTSACYFGL